MVSIVNPLQISWFYRLAVQSNLRFRLLELAVRALTVTRSVEDRGKLNTSDRLENRLKRRDDGCIIQK